MLRSAVLWSAGRQFVVEESRVLLATLVCLQSGLWVDMITAVAAVAASARTRVYCVH